MNNHSFQSGDIKLFMLRKGDVNPSQVPIISAAIFKFLFSTAANKRKGC